MPGNAVLFAVLCAVALHRPQPLHRPEAEPGPAPARPRLRVVASNAYAGCALIASASAPEGYGDHS